MHDACRVGSCKSAGDLCGDIQHFAELHRRVSHLFAQRLAINKFSGYEANRISLVDLVDREDVGMIQRGSSFCFLHKAAHPILIGCKLGGQNLKRDFAIEFRVPGQIHLAHSTFTYLRADFVTSESCSRGNESCHARLTVKSPTLRP